LTRNVGLHELRHLKIAGKRGRAFSEKRGERGIIKKTKKGGPG